MQLFMWAPQGHGQETVMVVEESEEKAWKKANAFVEKELSDNIVSKHHYYGWGTEYYEFSVHAPGVVVTHSND